MSIRVNYVANKTRKELFGRKTKGPKNGEAKRNEVKFMGIISGSMLFSLTLLNG